MSTMLFPIDGDVPRPAPPRGRLLAIRFTVAGEAQAQGSKISHPLPKRDGSGYVMKNGRPAVVTREDNADLKDWRLLVAQTARAAYSGPLLVGALNLSVTFYRPRLASHFGAGRNAGRLKSSAPDFPITRPDTLKLARAVEDALTGVLYRDDSQIVDHQLAKRYGDHAHVDVTVTSLDGLTEPRVEPKDLVEEPS